LAAKWNEMNPFKVFIFIQRKLLRTETFQDYSTLCVLSDY
jgi:hypothetical protein